MSTDMDAIRIRESQSRHPKWVYATFGTSRFLQTFIWAVMDFYLLWFYNAVLGLSAWHFAATQTAFAIWDAFNDPLLAWFIDKNYKFTRKYGRRFPMMVVFLLPWVLASYLIFAIPQLPDAAVSPWPTVLWLFFTLALFDTFGTIVSVSITLLIPDKFRTESERRTFTTFATPFSMLAQAAGALIPPMLLAGETVEAYRFVSLIVAIISLVIGIIMLFGAKEDKIIIDRYYSEKQEKEMGFFKGLWETLKLKSFIVFFLVGLIYMTVGGMLAASFAYISNFTFQDPGAMMGVMTFFLSGSLISVPFWMWLAKKLNDNKKVLSIALAAFGVSLIPMFFFTTVTSMYILIFIVGFGMGGYWGINPLIQANIFDDFMVKTKRNQKGVMQGTNAILNRLAQSVDIWIIALVQIITGYQPGKTTFGQMWMVVEDMDAVLMGIRLQISLIPAVLLLIIAAVFWFFYPLSQIKVFANKVELDELGL